MNIRQIKSRTLRNCFSICCSRWMSRFDARENGKYTRKRWILKTRKSAKMQNLYFYTEKGQYEYACRCEFCMKESGFSNRASWSWLKTISISMRTTRLWYPEEISRKTGLTIAACKRAMVYMNINQKKYFPQSSRKHSVGVCASGTIMKIQKFHTCQTRLVAATSMGKYVHTWNSQKNLPQTWWRRSSLLIRNTVPTVFASVDVMPKYDWLEWSAPLPVPANDEENMNDQNIVRLRQ